MKAAAAIYFSTITYLREIAQELGYALAVHGSMARDLDLLACPWVDDAKPAMELAEALRKKLEMCTGEKWYMRHDDPGKKPHGRLAWNLFPGCGGQSYIDLSVMPLLPRETAAEEAKRIEDQWYDRNSPSPGE